MSLLRVCWVAAGLLAMVALNVGAQTPAPAKPDKLARLALVIGNAAYKDDKLINPVNDAQDMASLLKQSGFEVVYRENASLREMHLALREFGDRLGRETLGCYFLPATAYRCEVVIICWRSMPISCVRTRSRSMHWTCRQ